MPACAKSKAEHRRITEYFYPIHAGMHGASDPNF